MIPCPGNGAGGLHLYGTVHAVATVCAVWQTVRMTSQANQQQLPRHREDYKVQKLVERIETKLALKTKAIREASEASSKN